MITPCPYANEGCPYYGKDAPPQLEETQEHGCYSDTDHVIPQALGRRRYATTLLKHFISTPANKVQRCRWEHDFKTEEEQQNPPQLPSEKFMIDAIRRARYGR